MPKPTISWITNGRPPSLRAVATRAIYLEYVTAEQEAELAVLRAENRELRAALANSFFKGNLKEDADA